MFLSRKGSFLRKFHPGKVVLLFLAVLFWLALSAVNRTYGESRKELEKKKKQIHKEIESTNQLLKQTKKSKSASINQLVMLNKKISYRQELISTIHSELSDVDNEIGSVSNNIDSLKNRITYLKGQYGQMLYYAYRNQSAFSRIMFVFSSANFNQAYKRMKYLHALSEYRIRQKEAIVALQDSLNGKKQTLVGIQTEKKQLLTSQQEEKRQLDREKKEQVNVLNDLTSKEKKLRADLREKMRQEQKLANKIEDIIRREIEMAQQASKKKSNSTTTASTSQRKYEASSASVLSNTPESIKLSNDFESNRGHLPWPVEQGVISSSFGRHSHPVWKDVVVNNNGVDISSTRGSKARAIFDGKVLRVLLVVDKYAVLIQHGEYFTLYSNLEQVYVKPGDKVITKQPIGSIQTNDDDGKTEVHLEIWQGSNKMNPENWIASRR